MVNDKSLSYRERETIKFPGANGYQEAPKGYLLKRYRSYMKDSPDKQENYICIFFKITI